MFFVCCHHTRNVDKSEKCMELAQAGHNYANKAHLELNPSFLDSALMYYNEAEKLCPEKRNAISYNKSQVYFEKKDYEKAIKMLEQIRASDFEFPELKVIFQEKIRAKSAGEQRDSISQKRHYRNIVANFDDFLETYRIAADSIMQLPDGDYVGSTLYGMNLAERYYYRAKIVGKQKTLAELDSLQKSTGYNLDYINWVKDVVSGDKGQSIQILFE